MCQTSKFHETHYRSLRERISLTLSNDGAKREYIANWKQRPQVVQQLKCDFEIRVATEDEEMGIDSLHWCVAIIDNTLIQFGKSYDFTTVKLFVFI